MRLIEIAKSKKLSILNSKETKKIYGGNGGASASEIGAELTNLIISQQA